MLSFIINSLQENAAIYFFSKHDIVILHQNWLVEMLNAKSLAKQALHGLGSEDAEL